MGWTNKPPTEPGFYYWQGGRLTGRQVAVVHVSAYHDKERPLVAKELYTQGYKNAPKDGAAKDWGGKWAGPLPQLDELGK